MSHNTTKNASIIFDKHFIIEHLIIYIIAKAFKKVLPR